MLLGRPARADDGDGGGKVCSFMIKIILVVKPSQMRCLSFLWSDFGIMVTIFLISTFFKEPKGSATPRQSVLQLPLMWRVEVGGQITESEVKSSPVTSRELEPLTVSRQSLPGYNRTVVKG